MKLNNVFFSKEDLVLKFGKGQSFDDDKQTTLIRVIEQQASISPQAIAVWFNEQCMSYKQLDEHANQLSRYLVRQNIQSKTRIAIYLEPSLDLVISLLAVLKVGGCYVPLDIHYPVERLKFFLQQSAATVLITQSNLSFKLLDVDPTQLIELDQHRALYTKEETSRLPNCITADDHVYMIYTSGSTGIPKGVAIHNRAIMNHMYWMQRHFTLDVSDVILFKTPFSFDPSVWEIFLPFFMGAQLIISQTQAYLSPASLLQLIHQYNITTIQFVPALLEQFLQHLPSSSLLSLRHVFVGGESLTKETKTLFFKKLSNCQLHNLYGPTEATIEIASHTVTSSDQDMNANIIGKPIYNTQFYVLNDDKQLVDVDEEGELYIAGVSLAHGYYANEQETNKYFIDNPFHPEVYKKMYATGDLVKWSTQGDLIYVGRRNDQIKINGVRIEPNELIWHILNKHPVSNCIITKKLDHHNQPFLACYLLAMDSKTLNISKIHHQLKQFFPNVMLPKRYALIDSIPITVNGKIDFKALPVPTIIPTSMQNELCSHPIMEIEKELLKIWKILLNIETAQVNDNFFELGGSSIMTFQLMNHIQSKFKVNFSIQDVFIHPTIYDQAKQISALKKSKVDSYAYRCNILLPLQTQGTKTPLFLIHPIGGTIFWYTLLARALDYDRPVYGIQDPGIELKKEIFSSIEDIAATYLDSIQQIQPSGPYIIGGASFGATVALEIAYLLMKKNEQIATVPILDGWAVYPNTLRDDQYFKLSMLRQHVAWKEQFKQHHLPDPSDLFRIQQHRLSLLWKYRLPNIQHPIALFKAQELLPAFAAVEAPFNHWEKYTVQSISRYFVPGNHETMFQKPHVMILACCLQKCLNLNDNGGVSK